jgi:site-specific recombinase XerD
MYQTPPQPRILFSEPDASESAPTSASPVLSFAKSNRELLEAFETYLLSLNRSPATRRAYLDAVGRFIEVLGSKDAAEADRSDIRRFQSQLLAKGVTANSVRLHIGGIRAFSKFLRLAGLTRHDPTLLLAHRKLPVRVPRVLTVKEVERLAGAGQTPLEKAVVEVLYSTGVRISELVILRVEDITFSDPGVIRVLRGKGNKDRIVLFGRRAAMAIRNYLGDRRTGFLLEVPPSAGELLVLNASWYARFYVNGLPRTVRLGRARHRLDSSKLCPERVRALHASGLTWREIAKKLRVHLSTALRASKRPKPSPCLSESDARAKFEELKRNTAEFKPRGPRRYDARSIRLLLSHLAFRAKLAGVHPHALRRAFATHLLEGGADLRVVQELLGHVNVTTTAVYTNLSAAHLKQVHDRCHPHAKRDENVEEK